jgi:hypothetical protein
MAAVADCCSGFEDPDASQPRSAPAESSTAAARAIRDRTDCAFSKKRLILEERMQITS